MLARDTHNSKAWYVTATPGMAMLAVAETHIQPNRMGWQCVARCCDEQNAQSWTRMSPRFPLQVRHRRPIPHSGPQKAAVPQNPENSGPTPTPLLGQARACATGGMGAHKSKTNDAPYTAALRECRVEDKEEPLLPPTRATAQRLVMHSLQCLPRPLGYASPTCIRGENALRNHRAQLEDNTLSLGVCR